MRNGTARSCEDCAGGLVRLGGDTASQDRVVALAGNPNTGKSTVFNALTGLRQHTGNWPGKTVARAEGGFAHGDRRYKLVDLPGTYSLLSAGIDEEIARDFLLFGRPDVTVIVVDANRLERNLNLALQVLEITERVVICLNLVDEAERHGIEIDARSLARELGVPVVPTAARFGRGLDRLHRTIDEVARGRASLHPRRAQPLPPRVERAVGRVADEARRAFPDLDNARWIALRLLDGDARIVRAVREGRVGRGQAQAARELLETASALRWEVGRGFHESLAETLYAAAAGIADRVVRRSERRRRFDPDRVVDRLVTSRVLGFPLMLAMLAGIFWITVSGANLPSRALFALLIDSGYPALKSVAVGLPWWASGLLIDGVYLTTAWVVAVMLPPMAIFFPLFTLLEDLGYLPRVAFNLDHLFQRVGAHGKQALTMTMGYGCNAAGVVATRIIESPRERLLAILTNNFALCNGRWPTQILIASIFLGALAPAHLAGLVSALAVVSVALLGVGLTFLTSWALSRTMLRGEVSAFTLELPPYRPPRLLQTIYRSLVDRTAFVLGRAVLFAAPAGALIWLTANLPATGPSLAERAAGWLEPAGLLLGLSGVILLAYCIALPANEIVIPTVLMLTVLIHGIGGVGSGTGVLFELEDGGATADVLRAGGWTLLTAVNVMLFSLVHHPCTTTLYTIWKETRSVRWTAISALLPLGLGLTLCFLVTRIWRLVTDSGF